MSALNKIAQTIGLSIIISSAIFTTNTYATDISEAEAKIEALAYAPEGSFNDERFSQFEFENEEYSEHELNDGWLGMPTYSKGGKLIGYIEDAILDENGFLTQIIIGLNEQQVIIEISGEYAQLTDEKVHLELSKQQIAQLASSNKLASLQ